MYFLNIYIYYFRKRMSMSGMKWTKEEENKLLYEVKLGRTFAQISEKHNRSEIAIHLRFASIVNQKIKQNQQSIHAIAKELNLKPDSIQNILDKAEKYNVNNNKNNDSLDKKISFLEQKIDSLEEKLNSIEKYCKSIYKKIK